MLKLLQTLHEIRHNRSSSSRKVLILASGTTLAQFLTILFLPIIGRMYKPVDYAVLALFTSIQTVLQAIATGRYEFAIVLPKKDKDSYALVLISLGILSTICLATLLLVVLMRYHASQLLGNPNLAEWLWLLPLSLFIVSANDIMTYWATRNQIFHKLAISRVSASLTKSAVNMGYKLFFTGPGGLIMGGMLSLLFPVIYLRDACLKMLSKTQRQITWSRIKSRINVYRHFPMFTMPNSLLNVISSQLPIFLIARFFSQDDVGSYSYAMQMMNFPMVIIGSSVGQVFYQHFTQQLREGKDGRKLLLKTWKRLAVMGILPMTAIFLWGPFIFSFLFGHQWVTAGKIAAIMAPSVLGVFISSPTSSATLTLNLQKPTFFFGLSQVIYRPLALYIGSLHHSLFIGMYIYVITDLVFFSLYNLNIWKHVPKVSSTA